ncbi:hypothetical protein EV368DRAFT_84481 [Lentinula lateritia]|nr:hypothetical protein EV368DRAFT_84481 [Lentinula lateritia]
MSNHCINITRPGRSVSSDRGREHRSLVSGSSNIGFPRPLATPPGFKTQAQERASSSLSRNSLSRNIGIDAGFWNWDPEKAAVVFCRKSNNLEYRSGSLPTKSPAKVIITTKSPAMAFAQPEPSNSLPRLSMIDSSSRPFSPTSVSGFESPSLAVRGLASRASSVTLSSPPPLHFNSDFTGWLLPDGVDTSIPDDNSELPDQTDSSFAFASSSNPDLNTSTISSNSEHIPPTPGRGVGLGFGQGFAHNLLSGGARVFCHDSEISEAFLKETAFEAAGVSNEAISPLDVRGLYGGGYQSGYGEVFGFPTASCFSGKNGEREFDSTLKLPSETISNFKDSTPCLSFSSTPHDRTSSSSVSPCPSPTSPSLRRHSRSQVPEFTSSSSKRPKGCFNEGSVGKPTTSNPAAAKRNIISRTITLHHRGGRDVTLATISSSLKRSNSSGSSSPTRSVSTADRHSTVISDLLFSRVPQRILGHGPREYGADLKKMKGCPAVTVHPRHIPQQQAKVENEPRDSENCPGDRE